MLLTCRICEGQNLVPNPSFEIYDTCPNGDDQIYRAIAWHSTRGTSDYFNSCAQSTAINYSVPSNYYGYQYAASGNAYAGFSAKSGPFPYREYLGAQLISPLQSGIKYYASFKVCLTNASTIQYCGINKLGILFSTIHYDSINQAPICNCAQIYTDSIIIDSTNWTRIRGSFIADSNYSFINIGRFFDNAFTDSIQVTGNYCSSYYYVDDVCVSTDSAYAYNYTYTGIENIYQNNLLDCFPNPFYDKLNYQCKDNEQRELFLFDITGRNLLQKKFINSTFINTEQLAKGLYLYEVRGKDGSCKKGKVMKD